MKQTETETNSGAHDSESEKSVALEENDANEKSDTERTEESAQANEGSAASECTPIPDRIKNIENRE